MGSAIVLLSGGLDSTVSAYLCRPEIEPVLALTVDYGQKAARRELAASYKIAIDLGIDHRTVFIPFLREASKGALTDPRATVPEPSLADLDIASAMKRSAAQVWVPNRNLAFITMAATWAEANDIDHVICGFNREEAATFPDNSEAFIESVNKTLSYSTRNGVTVVAPTSTMSKAEIVAAGRRLGAPLERVWACYLGGDRPCTKCESCVRFQRALDVAGVVLP